MVFAAGKQKEETSSEERFIMAVEPERSRTLHNFSLPCLKWGGQKNLRCVKDDDDDTAAHFQHSDRRSPVLSGKDGSDSAGPSWILPESEKKRKSLFESEIGQRSTVDCDGDDGIEAVRKKLMFDLQTEMEMMKFTVLNNGSDEAEPSAAMRVEAPVVDEAKPWNLRTRRAAGKEPYANGGGKNPMIDEENCSYSPAKGAKKFPARRNDVGGGEYSGSRRQRPSPRPKFSVSLTKEEIEADFIALTGSRPPRKPKRRPKNVQKQLDTLSPGLWLSEITADMYKVNENPEPGKK